MIVFAGMAVSSFLMAFILSFEETIFFMLIAAIFLKFFKRESFKFVQFTVGVMVGFVYILAMSGMLAWLSLEIFGIGRS